MRAEGVGLAGQPFCIERDTVLMAGSEFTAGEHQFKLFEQQWKCLVEMRVAELSGDAGPVSEIMQTVARLHQPCAKTGRDTAFKPPLGFSDIVVYYRCFIRQF